MRKQEWSKPRAKELDVLLTAAYFSTYDLYTAAKDAWRATFNPNHPTSSQTVAWNSANSYS